MQIHHQCRTPACVNPSHLTVVTRRRNLQNRRFDSWQGIDDRITGVSHEPLTVTLTPEHSAWLRARAAETGETADELVARAMYRYMARWLGRWKDTSE